MKICPFCGASFTPTCNSQIYCSRSCATENHKSIVAKWQREHRDHKGDLLEERKPYVKPDKSIEEINEIASENGMSYGQYVAMRRAK